MPYVTAVTEFAATMTYRNAGLRDTYDVCSTGLLPLHLFEMKKIAHIFSFVKYFKHTLRMQYLFSMRIYKQIRRFYKFESLIMVLNSRNQY